MLVGDPVDSDAVVVALEALRTDERTLAELAKYGGGSVSGEVKPPYPCVVVRPTLIGIPNATAWRTRQDILVSAVGDRVGVPGDGALRDIAFIAVLALLRLPDVEITDPTQSVVSYVESTSGIQPLDPIGGHPRWQGGLALTLRPPTEKAG